MLSLKALERGSRLSKATLVYHVLLSNVKAISVIKRQLIKILAQAESEQA